MGGLSNRPSGEAGWQGGRGGPKLTNQQVARLGAGLDPFAAVVGEPLHAVLGEAVPLLGPGGDALLVLHVAVEVLTQAVGALAHDEAAVLGAVGPEVDEPLQAAEAGLLGVLVLVRPRLVGRQMGPVREAVVDGVERHQQVLGPVRLLERRDHAGLRPHCPHEVLVRCRVVQEHALLVDDGQLVGVHRGRVVAVVAEATALHPRVSALPRRAQHRGAGRAGWGRLNSQGLQQRHHPIAVVEGALARNRPLDDRESVADEVIPPVAVGGVCAVDPQLRFRTKRERGLGLRDGGGGGHVVTEIGVTVEKGCMCLGYPRKRTGQFGHVLLHIPSALRPLDSIPAPPWSH